jgi:predicted DNA-binding transcriptional regulator YafY
MTPEYPFTTADLAAELGVTGKTIRRRAKELRIGIDLQGRAGFRYSAADRQRLIDSLKPAAPVAKRRKRRAA